MSSVNCDNIGRAGMFASPAPGCGLMKQGHQAIITRSIERGPSSEFGQLNVGRYRGHIWRLKPVATHSIKEIHHGYIDNVAIQYR